MIIKFEGFKFGQAQFVRYLGVFIDDKLNWTKQLDTIVTTLSVATWALYWLKKYIPKKSSIGVYYSIVHPHLQYKDINWGKLPATFLDKWQVKQNQIIKIITNNLKLKTRLLLLYNQNNILKI